VFDFGINMFDFVRFIIKIGYLYNRNALKLNQLDPKALFLYKKGIN